MSTNKVPILSRSRCKNVLKFSVENAGKIKLPIMIWGYHGIGKTQLVKDVAKELDCNLIPLHLATQDIIDLIGRPISVKDTDAEGNEVDVQDWCVPKWLHDALKLSNQNGKRNIFFLDEFNRGAKIVLDSMLPFLIEGVMHTHKINEHDAIIAACNPPSDDYEVNELTDKAQIDRLGHIILKTTVPEYVKYLKESKMDKTTIDVISANPDLVSIPDIEPEIELRSSMRSVDYVMRIVGQKTEKWIRDNAEDVIHSYLGEEFTGLWITARTNYSDLITMDMLINYDANEAEIVEAITSNTDNIKTANISILEKLISNILSYLRDEGGLTEKDFYWFTRFIQNDIIPGDDLNKIFNNETIVASILDPKVNHLFNQYVESLKNEEDVRIW